MKEQRYTLVLGGKSDVLAELDSSFEVLNLLFGGLFTVQLYGEYILMNLHY